MKPDDLIRDPVFQLNLLLWMAKEQPKDHWRVRPVFCEAGFSILYIEQPFRFPVVTSQAIKASPLAISFAPEPDLLLARAGNGKALYFEAKANSFGLGSSTCEQARGHLIAVGPAFSETYPPLNALLCYVLPDAARPEMGLCLGQLLAELEAAGLKPGMHSVHGLEVAKGDLAYRWDDAFSAHVGMTGGSAVVLKDMAEDTDPSPLLLVYTDEDCPTPDMQSFYRRAMLDQVRARLLCDLHAVEAGGLYQVSVDQLLKRTTEGIFDYLASKRQKSVRGLVRTNVLVPICKYWEAKLPGCVSWKDGMFTVRWADESEKDQLLDWLEDRSTRFPDDKPREDPWLIPPDGLQSEGPLKPECPEA